jgi:tRNA pseudouridine(55) synthase
MKPYIVIQKEVGETPLMALQKWKQGNPAYENISASYAGRLDPMAEGKLLILLGDECKKQKRYTGLDKEYEIEVLLDVESDTGDALGLVEYSGTETVVKERKLEQILKTERGAHQRRYPKFSSKTVNGKPLFLHTLEGTVGDIEIPEHEERIYKSRVQSITKISSEAFAARINTFLAKVPKSDESSKKLGADFRIDTVRASWEKLSSEAGVREFTILSLRVTCGSGTYMRSLAGRIGEALGTRALALSIKRTTIGKYWCGFWIKKF